MLELFAAVLALHVGFVRPDLVHLIAPEATQILWIRAPDLTASWATFFKHDSILTDWKFLYMRYIITGLLSGISPPDQELQ